MHRSKSTAKMLTDGIQHIDGEIERLVRAGVVNLSIALACATDPKELQKRLAK